jgi:orotate phosphoribosyltransferase
VIKDALVLVDRLEGGKANLAASGVRLNAFVDVRELAEILFDGKRITKADYQAVLKQMESGRR